MRQVLRSFQNIRRLLYITGFGAGMAKKQLVCMPCCNALGSRKNTAVTSFLQFKDRGGLFKPSKSVIDVCEEREKCLKRMLVSISGKIPREVGMANATSTVVLGNMLESAIEDNHIFQMIKRILRHVVRFGFIILEMWSHLNSERN